MLIPSLYQVNLFIHLVAVALWLGLTVNFSVFMVPLLRSLPDEAAESQMETIGKRARRMVAVLMVVLLLTGLINLYKVNLLSVSDAWVTSYGITVATKVTLALILFAAFPFLFVVAHRIGSDGLESRIRRMNYLHWGISGLTLLIMFLGVQI